MKYIIHAEEVYPYPRLQQRSTFPPLETEADLPWWLVALWRITHRLHVFCQHEFGRRSDYLEWDGSDI